MQQTLCRSLTLPNDIETIPTLYQFIDECAETVGLDSSLTMTLNLAIEEAVVNVMLYAYPEGTVGDVTIRFTATSEELEFVITDKGTPFDPTQCQDADVTLSAEERPIGGLGIFLERQLMDAISYRRADGQNILTMRKTLPNNPK
jgi:sigma-B regulation protein RsbU (phosphoserine phosphatase)